MQRIDNSGAVASLPAPLAAGTPGYFGRGNPGTGLLATPLSADWANQVQEELMAFLAAAGITPSKTTTNQVYAAVAALFLRISGGTITGNLVVNGNVTLGDSSGDAHTVNGSLAATGVVAGGGGSTGQATESVRGTLEVATAAEAQAFASDLVGITALKLGNAFQGANQSLAANGYQKLPGGLIFQWGEVSVGDIPAAVQDVSITYPVTFPSSVFKVFLSAEDTSGGNPTAIFWIKTKSPAGAVARIGETSGVVQNTKLLWWAIGL